MSRDDLRLSGNSPGVPQKEMSARGRHVARVSSRRILRVPDPKDDCAQFAISRCLYTAMGLVTDTLSVAIMRAVGSVSCANIEYTLESSRIGRVVVVCDSRSRELETRPEIAN
jgi:hypothetical protein